MRRAGTLEFTLKGQPMKLTAFVDLSEPDLNHLFVPFSDMTSGTESYPAGRYIDLYRNVTGVLLVFGTITVCDPGGAAPATATKMRPVG